MNTQPALELQDRHVLVTGAGSGIGLACVAVAAAQGARVAAVLPAPRAFASASRKSPGITTSDLLNNDSRPTITRCDSTTPDVPIPGEETKSLT